MNYNDRDILNRDALIDPHIGDYWHEMFVPYFVIVDIEDDVYTVLNFIRSKPNCAYIDNGDTWSIDFSKSIKVDKEWIERTVKYSSMDKFVAFVERNQRWTMIAQDWREYNGRS